MVLQEGKLVQRGSPQVIYQQPANEYTAALFGSYNLVPVAKANAFTRLFSIPVQNQSLMIRPENIWLTDSDNNEKAVPGKIKEVRFFGSFYEVYVQVKGFLFTVKTVGFSGKKGDLVFVTITPENIWPL